MLGVPVGQMDAARERVALPHHVDRLRVLHEIERLRGPEQLPGNASRITTRRRQEWHAALAGEHLLVRDAHLLGRPGLEDRVQIVADCERHLPAHPIIIALQRVVGMVLDRPAHSGRWIEPAVTVKGVAAVRADADPGPVGRVRGDLRNFSAALREDAVVRTKKDTCAQDECSNPLHIARGGCPTESHEQRRHFLGSPPLVPTASFLGLIGSHPAAFCYLKVWPNAGPITTVRLDALNKSLAPLPGHSWTRHFTSYKHTSDHELPTSDAMRSSTQAGKRVAFAHKATTGGPMTLHMTFLRRQFLLGVILATTAATSSLGQTPTPGPDTRAAQSAVSIPDFSGLWTHAALGFESPVSGPGPVRNLGRTPSGQSNFNQLIGDPANPILQPWAAEVVKKFGEISRAGLAFPDPDNQCLLNPLPYIFWNFEIQILQTPDKVIILYPHDQDHRQIRLNQRHPEKVTPSIHGDSVGHYEGDTLVIDTVGIKVSKYSMADRFGTPYTEALHVVERYRLIDYDAAKEAQARAHKEWPRVPSYAPDPNYRGKGLQLEFTVTDAGAFTTPWKGTITYLRSSNKEWYERVCAENIQHY